MKYTKEKIRDLVRAEIKKGGFSQVEYCKMLGLSSALLSQFLGEHIEYVPQKILDHYHVGKRIIPARVEYFDLDK